MLQVDPQRQCGAVVVEVLQLPDIPVGAVGEIGGAEVVVGIVLWVGRIELTGGKEVVAVGELELVPRKLFPEVPLREKRPDDGEGVLQLPVSETVSEIPLEEESRRDVAGRPTAEPDPGTLHLIEANHLSDRADVEVASTEELVPVVLCPYVSERYHVRRI